ncbi:mandelate racemase/muconate lactonizing enzyme family protein [Halovivax limisalsi]|uniref:mandelate racemase/muconate lactonizing enzyme family protein n=1 Tax=Halovivax limisalsi TaxID=1453760 RepID=UPI001FFCA52C|nr:enolase C-terminal domain-like protein [Halovivax limisalsi]
MEITRVETVPYGIPVEGFADSYTEFERSNAVLVRIHADTGHVGIGEACAWEPEFYGETLESIDTTIRNYAAPAIVGEDPTDIGRVLRLVDERLARITCVKEGIDLALHDLVGKILEVPAYTLLGGKFRDSVRVAAEVGLDTPEAMVDEALDILGDGIEVVKIKGSSDPDLDVRRIRAIRDELGDDVPLRLDPNAAWNATETIRVLRAVEDCHLQVVEQPVPTDDLSGLAHVRANSSVPVMADESIWTSGDAVTLYDYDAADLVNLKIAKTCGLHRGKKIETAAEALGLGSIAGTELEPGISSVAKVHFAASMRDHPLASEFTELVQVDGSILETPLEVVDGAVDVPDGPGFGVEIDEDALQEYAIDVS